MFLKDLIAANNLKKIGFEANFELQWRGKIWEDFPETESQSSLTVLLKKVISVKNEKEIELTKKLLKLPTGHLQNF